ncbi:hypothetical protein NAC44_06065 [Allorhizobium sp. BGMRC 0089]|uniref:hypothetical protein n=1 Tax=Allorhizobium sonneratiae TaxID=2934936 RepID=UPI002033CA35|nr:hypothetical protein [Allorhizobium sonneratiae]MCM2291892.1 hypothetical protein [Allorhizobium sonneratiae]
METMSLDLYGCWPLPAMPEDKAVLVCDLLERKAVDMVVLTDHFASLLNELTREMQAQFEQFRALRQTAEALIDGVDEAAAKLARADLKTATEAMSVIVRTLEKIDSLQRQLRRDRQEAEERHEDQAGFAEAEARLLALIDRQAETRARLMLEAWKAKDAMPGTGPPG